MNSAVKKLRTVFRRVTGLVAATVVVGGFLLAGPAPAGATTALQGPSLGGYDIGSLTLTGSGFLPSHRVWVRTAVSGSVPTCGGILLSDLRQSPVLLQATSDGAGNLSVKVDPKSTLPPLLVCDNPIQYLYGAYPGEQVHFSAHDERYVNGQLLWSNTFTVTA
ncbi:hypothetical protein [Amycolatopsis anabasis]|uniref:hypothetical protein n=1 Tax=Amycolatopsis anabasis TaxID=1840409 RepID=UPI001FE8354A|nr:hypothetical protein [Amycolatopsis anabasis]